MPDKDLAPLPVVLKEDVNRASLTGRTSRRRNRYLSNVKREIAERAKYSYNVSLPILNNRSASRDFLLLLRDDLRNEFEKHAFWLASYFGIPQSRYPDFRASLEGLPDRFKAASETQPPTAELTLPHEAAVLYMDRPDPDMNPIAFLRAHWGRYMDAGILYQDTLNDLDPQLVPNVRSYCQRMAKRDPDNAASYVAKDHLPPVRPKEARASIAITAEPGTVEYAVQKRKADQRERKARFRAKHGIPSPFSPT